VLVARSCRGRSQAAMKAARAVMDCGVSRIVGISDRNRCEIAYASRLLKEIECGIEGDAVMLT